MTSHPVILDELKLRELIVESTKSKDVVTSNLLGDIQKKLDSHSISLAKIETELKSVNQHFSILNGRVGKSESQIESLKLINAEGKGKKEGMSKTVSIVWAVVLIPITSMITVLIEKLASLIPTK